VSKQQTFHERRMALGLSQAALAGAAGMHPSTVSLIERGLMVPYPGQARKLAKVLRVEIVDLVQGSPSAGAE
jgi:transcriptional regulator with XRE-family HTH domain